MWKNKHKIQQITFSAVFMNLKCSNLIFISTMTEEEVSTQFGKQIVQQVNSVDRLIQQDNAFILYSCSFRQVIIQQAKSNDPVGQIWPAGPTLGTTSLPSMVQILAISPTPNYTHADTYRPLNSLQILRRSMVGRA